MLPSYVKGVAFMSLIPMGLFVVLITVLDQLSKLLVLQNIGYGMSVPCIPGLFHLTYVQNFGAAFSIFEGQRWLFILVYAGFVALVFWSAKKKTLPFAKLEWWCIAAILGGGLGNILDRVFRGYVVDMIAVDFMNFPVFNVADCFITVGAAIMLVHLIFFNRGFWKEDKKE